MYSNIKRGLLWLVAPLAFGLLSCSDSGGSLGAGFGSESDFNVGFFDTATVRTATVLLDSIPTNTGTLLIGKYVDPKLGTTESQIFMQMSNGPGWPTPSSSATFDSVVLILPYSGYYYGDTTATTELHVYQASKSFKTYPLPLFWQYEAQLPYYFTQSGGFFFNTSKVAYTTELGSAVIHPHPRPNPNPNSNSPHVKDSIHIRLPDALGSAWLTEAKKIRNSYFGSITTFLDHFKGITVKATHGASIVGINGKGVKIRVYYKDLVSELITQRKYELPISDASLAFNRITADRTGTLVENLGPSQKLVYSKDTGGETYIQSGIGILTKIEFPHIETLMNTDRFLALNNATLTIEPVKKTFSAATPLPPRLVMFETNKSNQPLTALPIDYRSDPQFAEIAFDPEFGTNTGYTFQITQFVQLLLNNPRARANGTALLLSTPATDFANTVNRATIGGGDNAEYRLRLNIYYTYKK